MADVKTDPRNAAADAIANIEPAPLLGQLLGPSVLSRLTGAFHQLCNLSLAICDTHGKRLDVAGETAVLQPGEQTGCFQTPIVWKDHRFGSVIVLDGQPDPAAENFAVLIADILASLCHFEAHIRMRVRELTAVYDLGGLFAGTLDLHAILNTAARRIGQVMNAKAACIRLLDNATGELVISGSYNLSEAYLNKGVVRADGATIDAEAFRGQVVYIEDSRTDPRVRYPEHARREGLVSCLSSPMIYRGRTVGVIRVYTGMVYRFREFEADLLRAVASQAAGAVVNSRLIREQIRFERQRDQFHHAGQVQRRMIPQEPVRHPRIQFGHVYEPSLQLGGDFFDLLDLPGGNVGVAIADVVGKGVAASLMMASVRSTLRAFAHSVFDIDDILGRVNRQVARDTQVSEFVTLCYGVFTPDGTRFTYCNAGHNPPLLLRKNTVTHLETGGLVIGVSADEVYEKEVVSLKSGDILVFYTDGITEALTFDGEGYGMDRLVASIKRYKKESAQTLANQLLWDVRRFAGLAEQTDDITIVVAKVS